MAKVDFIVVRAGPKAEKTRSDGGNRVALYEQSPDHPRTEEFPEGGEAFVAGPEPVLVGKTPQVVLMLRNDYLAEVTDKSFKLKHQPLDAKGNIVPIAGASSPASEGNATTVTAEKDEDPDAGGV